MKRILFISILAALLCGCNQTSHDGQGSTSDTIIIDSVADNVSPVPEPNIEPAEPEPADPAPEPAAEPAEAKPVTVEGVLKMYYISNTGEGGEVDTYIEGDGDNTCLVFAIVPDKPVDVRPYVDEEIDEDWAIQERFTILAGKMHYKPRAFAKKYANKRVRITGALVPIVAGWRYASEFGQQLDKIELVK